jgi:hypothetical protein
LIVEDIDVGRLSVDQEPLFIRFESEPFVLLTARRYLPVARVLVLKTKQRFYLILAASSLCQKLEPIRKENNGKISGIEIWIYKDGVEKTSKYVIEQ